MKVTKSCYNVLTIEPGKTLTSDTPTVIGTNADYEVIKKCTAKSGILRVKATIDGAAIFGTLNVNPWTGADKLECTCVTAAGTADATAVVATLEPSDDGLKATVSLVALAN